MIYSIPLITRKFVHWVLYTAGPYTQLIGHDVMIYSVRAGTQLCLDAYYKSNSFAPEYNFAIVSACNPRNVNQQWRIIGEAFP
jgi:hypothetical protein